MSNTPSGKPRNGHFVGLGGAFYPEHHPRRTWPAWVRRIADAGLSFVRMGEFAWDKFEPREGHYDFDWFDEVLARLDARGIRVILCTPTAVPPRWACEKYPEIFPVLEDGRTYGFGVRRYTCPTSIAYHRLSEGIVTEMARRYGRSPQILAWQIDNEVGHPFCFCERCRTHFQEWCHRRYGTIAAYNDALCTHFFGQTLTEFGQIPFPTTANHPGQWLIYHQFFSDQTIACFRLQADTLRAGGVRAPITTNMMCTWHGYDHEAMARHLDVVAADHYGLGPNPLFGEPFANEAFVSAYLRGIQHGQRNIWFHEFQCAGGPLPGRVRWNVLTQMGMGADLINFFRFDAPPSGCEREGSGMIGVHGQPGRVFGEVRRLARETAAVARVTAGTTAAAAEVAILYTHDNHCEFARTPKTAAFGGRFGNGYSVHLAEHYQAIAKQNIPCDIVYPNDDLSRYRVIVVPALFIVRQELADKLDQYVRTGGTLVLTRFSGYADASGRLFDQPVPGPLARICGIEVLDSRDTTADEGTRLVAVRDDFAFAPIKALSSMDEIRVRAKDVEVLAEYDSPFFRKVPAATRWNRGRGRGYYLGALLTQEGYDAFYQALARDCRLRPLLDLPAGVYVTARQHGRRRVYFINNPSPQSRTLELKKPLKHALTGQPLAPKLRLAPFDVIVAVPGSGRRA